jgi:hypothetical protein
MAIPTITILPSFGKILSQAEKSSDQTLQVTTTDVENTQSVVVSLDNVLYTQQMANNSATLTFPSSALSVLEDGADYSITANISNIYNESAVAVYSFTVFPVGSGDTGGIGAGVSGITIRDEGVVVGTAGSVTSINFVGPNVTATASGAGSTITISGGAGTVGIQSGGVLVGTAGTINFAGSGIGTISISDEIAVITVSGDYGEFGDT